MEVRRSSRLPPTLATNDLRQLWPLFLVPIQIKLVPISEMRTPKYRTRKDKPWAFVEVGGKRVPLPGKANSRKSKDAYHAICRRLLDESEPSRKRQKSCAAAMRSPTVAVLVDEYTTWASQHYLPRNGQRSCIGNIMDAVRPLLVLAGAKHVEDFGADDLERIRDSATTGRWITDDFPKCKKWSRQTANRHIGRIRQMFKWGVKKKIVPQGVFFSLQSLEPLRRGFTKAIDYQPILPVSIEQIESTIPFVTPVVAAMIRVQMLSGMRPGEVCLLRPCDVNMSGSVWVYTPEFHKTDYLGHHRPIAIGPRAQAVLEPFMNRLPDAYCFSPAESEKLRSEARRMKRKTRVQPSQACRKNVRTKDNTTGDRYRTSSYRRAVEYGIASANKHLRHAEAKAAKAEGRPPRCDADLSLVSHWHPNQLRHSAATMIRDQYGLEAAQVILGHRHASVTEIYAERDLKLAIRVASDVG